MKYSIITVALDPDNRILRTISSVFAQNFDGIELILQLARDKNNLVPKIKSMAENQNKCEVKIFVENDTGIYNAMNRALTKATGDIIGFLNADDYYSSADVLRQVLQQFHKHDASVVMTAIKFFKREDQYNFGRSFYPKKGKFTNAWHVPHPGFFFKMKSFRPSDLVYIENMRIAADVVWMLNLNSKNLKCVGCPDITSVKMEYGGISNRSFFNILSANLELYNALNKVFGSKFALLYIAEKLSYKILQKMKFYS
ncbi:glycosyltransferase [Rhodobacterales bacterium FZCC0083]|nr:glycosyltransferase [Rhodobacterales bacterium FZCC0083]